MHRFPTRCQRRTYTHEARELATLQRVNHPRTRRLLRLEQRLRAKRPPQVPAREAVEGAASAKAAETGNVGTGAEAQGRDERRYVARLRNTRLSFLGVPQRR